MEGGFRNRPIHHSFRGFQDIQTCSCSRQNVYTSVFILLSLFKKGTYIFKRFYFQTLLIKNRRNVSQTQTLYLSGPKLLRPASPPTPSQVREESLRQTEHRRAQLCVHVMKHLKPFSPALLPQTGAEQSVYATAGIKYCSDMSSCSRIRWRTL